MPLLLHRNVSKDAQDASRGSCPGCVESVQHPLVPAKAGTQITNREQAALDSRHKRVYARP